MSDFFSLALDEALPKKLPQSIELLEDPKKPIDPCLAARLVQRPASPSKTTRNESFIKQVLYPANCVSDASMTVTAHDWEILSSFVGQSLDEVFPKKMPAVIELLEDARGSIQPTLASRLERRSPVKC